MMLIYGFAILIIVYVMIALVLIIGHGKGKKYEEKKRKQQLSTSHEFSTPDEETSVTSCFRPGSDGAESHLRIP